MFLSSHMCAAPEPQNFHVHTSPKPTPENVLIIIKCINVLIMELFSMKSVTLIHQINIPSIFFNLWFYKCLSTFNTRASNSAQFQCTLAKPNCTYCHKYSKYTEFICLVLQNLPCKRVRKQGNI